MILFFRFFSIRPTDSISGNAFDAKQNLEFAQQRNRHWLRVDKQTNVPFGSLKMITSPHFNCFIVILAIIIIIIIVNINSNINIINNVNINININNHNSL